MNYDNNLMRKGKTFEQNQEVVLDAYKWLYKLIEDHDHSEGN